MPDTLYAAPVVPGREGAARGPHTRADKVLMGRLHLARSAGLQRADFLAHLPAARPSRGRLLRRWRIR